MNEPSASRLATTVDIVAIVVFAVGFGALVWLDETQGTLRDGFVWNTVLWYLIAFAGFLMLLRRQSLAGSAFDWRWLLVLGLLARVVLLSTTPTLSDDVYRYLWEGHLVTEGVSPYTFTIDSPLGEAFDIPARGLANNASLASPYLPAAHGIFGIAAFLLPSQPWTMQVIMILFDIVAVAAMMRLLRSVGLPARRCLIYWLNPLVIIEVAHGAHLDAIIVGLTMTALWLTIDVAKRSPNAAFLGAAVLGVATLTRPLAVMFVPILFWMWNWRQRLLYALTVFVPIAITGAWVGLGLSGGTGTGVFGSTLEYTETFRFNTAVYQALERWLGAQGVADPLMATRIIIAVAVAAPMAAIFFWARRPRNDRATIRLLALPVILYVLLAPVMHPWYTLLLMMLLPFLAPGPGEGNLRWVQIIPWLTLAALLIFSYVTYLDPEAHAERLWIRHLQWYPTIALATIAVAGARATTMRQNKQLENTG